jgi:hypothetical protein
LEFDSESWREDYEYITEVLNKVLIYEFNISLHSVDSSKCNINFSRMINELNHLYKQHENIIIPDIVVNGLKAFYKSRKYD